MASLINTLLVAYTIDFRALTCFIIWGKIYQKSKSYYLKNLLKAVAYMP